MRSVLITTRQEGRTRVVMPLGKGDLPGHPFRGNQHTGGIDGDPDAVHFGDGGIGHDTLRHRMSYGRSTGHFGTGTYFLSAANAERVRGGSFGVGSRGAINLRTEGLNLARPSDPKNLHDALRYVNGLAGNADPLDFESPAGWAGKASFYAAVELGFGKQKAIEAAILHEVTAERAGLPDHEIRTAATRVMQRLGYDGVDVRGTRYDNTDYGSVIYHKPVTKLAKRHATSETRLERVVERTFRPVAAKVEHALSAAAKRVAALVAEKYAQRVMKGDLPGHPFRGNQWTVEISGTVDAEHLVQAKIGDKVIGSAKIIAHPSGGHFGTSLEVSQEYRRQGVATSMYDFVQRELATTMKPRFIDSDDGEAFWTSRKASQRVMKGDLPGHPFRGNQWVDGIHDVYHVTSDVSNLSSITTDGFKAGVASVNEVTPTKGRIYLHADARAAATMYDQMIDNGGSPALIHMRISGEKLRGMDAQHDEYDDNDSAFHVRESKDLHRHIVNISVPKGATFPKLRGGYGARVAEKLAKDATSADVRRILAELELKGVSVQVLEEIKPDLIRAFGKAGILGVGRIGLNTKDITNHVDQKAIEYARERAAELVTKITETSREAIRDEVERGVTEGLSPQELANNVRESRAFSRERSIMIARTELAFAHVAGNIEGWRATGQVKQKQWQASINCCPICDLMDGVVVDLEDKFDFDGEQVDGPPGHPNCRCDVLPVLT